MKKIIVFLMALIIMSCADVPDVNNYYTVSGNELGTAINVKVFPSDNRSTRSKDTDFINGIMYIDNAYATDGLIHEIDLSGIIGKNKSALVALQFKVIEGCDNEYFMAKIRPKGIGVNYQNASAYYNNPSDLIYIVTNDEGLLEWYSDYSWPFEKWVKVEVWAVWYSVGTIVN
jgi:hypothetical protein